MLTATNNSFLIADRQKKEGKFFKIMGLTEKLSNEMRTKPILLLTTNFKEYAGKIDVISGGFPVDWTELPFKNCEKKV